MKLVKAPSQEEIGVKRFYLPYEISDEGPKCGETISWEDYVSYPVLGKPEKLHFYHYVEETNEEHEWHRKIIIDITVTPV